MYYVAEVEYYDLIAEEVRRGYYGTAGFETDATEMPALQTFKPWISAPALIRRDIFDIDTTGGESRIGFGELTMNNEEGNLNDFRNRSVDGRELIIRITDDINNHYPEDWDTLLVGTMEQYELTQAELKIRIRDRQMFSTAAFQPNKYGGTNVLPLGVDGIESDLKGKPKPRALGACFNVEPQWVNTSKLIVQFNDGPVRDIPALYDAGGLLPPGLDYDDEAQMIAVAPARGTYRKWKGDGMARLGSPPQGQVTGDVVTGLTPMERTAGSLFAQVLAEVVDPSIINMASVALLNAKQKGTLGLYYREETTYQQVLGDIARTPGAWWGQDLAGLIGIARLEPISEDEPVAGELNSDNMYENTLKLKPLADAGLPVHRVTARGVPNYTVQNNGLLTSVGAARRARLGQASQQHEVEDLAVKLKYLLSPEMFVDTKFSCLQVVVQEAVRLLAMYKERWERWDVDVHGKAAFLTSIDLGKVFWLRTSKYGGINKKVRILGYQINPVAGQASLTVWG